ncbi:MAG: transporter [Halioglobus sp.]
MPGVSQELTPRAYWPAPTGTQVATIGYSYVSGDTIPDPSLPLTGVDSKIGSLTVGYLQTLDLWGRTANVTLELPYSDGETDGETDFGLTLAQDYKGMGDAALSLSVNFMGAPAMNAQEFAALRASPGPILGGSIKIVAPTGSYDSDNLINVGANRWALKAELGFIAPLAPKWLFELDLGVWMFQDNDDFLGFTKEQNPITAIQAHLVHILPRGTWASFDASYYKGGRSTLAGRRLDDLQRDSKIGVTLVYPFAHKQAVKVGYSVGSLNDSEENFDVWIIAYSRIF